MDSPELSFEEWFGILSSFDSDEDRWNCDLRMHSMPDEVVAKFLERLLRQSPEICKDMNPAQVGHMINFIQGVDSEYWHAVVSDAVPRENQIETVMGLSTFYEDFLDPYISNSNFANIGDTCEAVHMIWDCGGLSLAARSPGLEYLLEPIFRVLDVALNCRSYECQISALHGLGHLHRHHAMRVEAIIDNALVRPGHLKISLIEYAQAAREGKVL